jgi:hypothetical protein
MNNLVNGGQLPEVPVSVEIPSKTWIQLTAVVITLIALVVIGTIVVKNT